MEPGKKAFTLVWLFWSFGLELEVKSCLDDVSWLCERHLQTTSLAFCALWNLEVSLVKGHLKRSRVVHLFPPQLYFTPRAKVDQKNLLGKMTFGLTWVKIINIPRKKQKCWAWHELRSLTSQEKTKGTSIPHSGLLFFKRHLDIPGNLCLQGLEGSWPTVADQWQSFRSNSNSRKMSEEILLVLCQTNQTWWGQSAPFEQCHC